MEKKHLVFDAYGTLLQVSSHISGLSVEQQKLSEKIQALWRSKQLEYTWLRGLMGKFEGFNQVTQEALTYACNFYNMEDQNLKNSILSIFKKPTAFQDAQQFLQACKSKGFQTAILSNGELEMLEKSVKIACIDDHIDHILSVSNVEVFKPSPKVYDLATQQFSCDPSDIVFFSSNPWDIAGATHFGFQTIWINRKGLPFDELGVEPWRVFNGFDGVSLEGLQ